MQAIQIIDEYRIQFYKKQWSEDEIFLAQCLEMEFKNNFIVADIRITWKTSVNGFMKKVFASIYFQRPAQIKHILGQLRDMYDKDFNDFKRRYAKRLDYSKKDRKLRNYQLQVVYRTVNSKYKLLALDMGTGKTITSATVARVIGATMTSVIAPSIAKWNWYEDMCHEWGFNETQWSILEPKNRRSMRAIIERFSVINYEMIDNYFTELKSKPIDYFIIDECHACKNITAKRTRNVDKLFKAHPHAKRVLLSGTPWTNRVTDLYAYLKICGHPLGKRSRKYFEDTYALKNGSKVVGIKNQDDLKLKISNFMIRLKSDDVLELPKLIINKAYFELGSLKNEYDDIIKEMEAIRQEYDSIDELDEEKKKAFKFAAKIRSSISSLSRITAMSKIPEVVKWVEDLNERGHKVVIFSSWRSVLEELEKKLSCITVRIDGSVAPNKRQELVNQFKKDEDTMVFLGQVKAAGVAINLVNANICILMDIPVSPDLIEQPIKRLHRSGQTKPVKAYFTFAKGTIDERIYSLIVGKARDINDIIDADTKRGVVRYENIEETLFKELTNESRNQIIK